LTCLFNNPKYRQADYEQHYRIVAPKKCTHPDGCNNSNFEVVQPLDGLNYKDLQEIKLQVNALFKLIETMP